MKQTPVWPGAVGRRFLQRIAAALSILSLIALPLVAQAVETPGQGPAQIVHILDYIALDYGNAVVAGKIEDAAEFAEMNEFAGNVGRLIESTAGADPAARAALHEGARRLAVGIAARTEAAQIAALAGELKRQAVAAWKIRTAPRRTPDLARGAAIYAEQCAGCHGVGGRGDGPQAKGLAPPPSNFFDRERMARLSLQGLYNTITLGVEGTAMTARAQLTEDDRWALAFHVGGLATTNEDLAAGEARWLEAAGTGSQNPPIRDLAALASRTARDAGADAGLLAWLTRHPEALDALRPDPLTLARRLLADSVVAANRGQYREAQSLAVAAYLEGFELAERGLDAVDPALRIEIEAEMMAFRKLVAAADAPAMIRRAEVIDGLLETAAGKLASHRLTPTAAGLSAFGILFREGLEAILVLAAIGAGVVRATGSRAALRQIHVGWIAALVAGALTWLIAEKLVAISGATREMTEGVTALISAAILLYVGFWLHGKVHAEHWQRFLDNRLEQALSRGTLGLVTTISFLAVYREAFETVLFYQALEAQAGNAGSALAIGTAAALLALVGVAWAVFAGGLRLPLGVFFRLSAALLAVLAVVFAGQGIAALQEAGSVGSDTVAFFKLPVLGIYPTLQTLAAQAAALLLIAAALLRQRRTSRAGRETDRS